MASETPPLLSIEPPLLNSANPWATTLDDLRALYRTPSTGAVTTRTSLLKGFQHDPSKHKFVFFDQGNKPVDDGTAEEKASGYASLNSFGYSPITLDTYLSFIRTIASENTVQTTKTFFVSVTGTPEDIANCYKLIAQQDVGLPLAMEINLSCPNIPNSPPPAYSGESLGRYLQAVDDVIMSNPDLRRIPFGLKTPPYTHSTEFQTLIDALLISADRAQGGVCPVTFITATNTLGSCLVMTPDPSGVAQVPTLPDAGLGGMGGAPIHPLALGNVTTLRRLLDAHQSNLGHIQLIGVGGVLDANGYRRMKAVGAYAVGVGTGLGLHGVSIFENIKQGLQGQW